MTSHYNASGVWKTTTPYVNIGGTWKIPKSAWINLSSSWKSWFLQGGLNDIGFNTYDDNTSNFNDYVYDIDIQSDGKIIIGGNFTTFNGTTVNRIVRLNSDETIDNTFLANTGTGCDLWVNSIAIQSDGKIILGGNFNSFNGTTVNKIVRLNSNGTIDTAFTTNIGSGGNFQVSSISIQSDGKIVVGGEFGPFNGVTVNSIVRLNSNGTIDTAFTTNTGSGINSAVYSTAIQSDGKIILGGLFTTFNGATVNGIVRLNSDGTRDTAFTTNTNTGTGGNRSVNSIAIQSDGKIVLGGSFLTFNGVTGNRIVRLNSDGTIDTAFATNTGSGFSNSVEDIAIQSDGKIIIAGSFLSFNGTTVNRIARLNSDGSLDTAFINNTNTGTGANASSFALHIQSDAKILVGGAFTTLNLVPANYIVRLNSDGTRATGFTPNINGGADTFVNSIAIQSDGKIIIGGYFTTFNGTTVNRIVRLNSDGTRDTAFTTNTGSGASDYVNSIAIQSDGKIIIGGNFSTFNGVTVNSIVRLNSDGTRDTAFTTNTGSGINNYVEDIAIQSDGKIIIGGFFTTFNGTTVNYIVRLNSNGTRDTAFTTNTGTGANSSIRSVAIQSDGKIILGGAFTTFNGVTVNGIVRLNSDGTRDTAFTTNTGSGADTYVNSIAIQSDGKIVVGGLFPTFNGTTVGRLVRLNSDGTIDTAFTTNTGSGASDYVNSIEDIAIQSDGKIVVGGFFPTFNGVTVNSIVRLNSDGTRDTAFTTNTGTGASSDVLSIAIQSDKKIIIGGAFTTLNNINRSRLARIGGDIAV